MADNKILTAYGTTAGNAHKNPHGPGATNSHDAVHPILVDGNVVGGVICDGCGSMPHSEIGSKFAVKAIADIVADEYAKKRPIQWKEVTKKALEQIKRAAKVYKSKDETLEDVIKNYFLFTVVIAVVRDNKVVIAACGDGVFIHDDEIWDIDIPIKNAPPYLAYNLIPSKYEAIPGHLDIEEVDSIPLEEIKKSVIIGSDGLSELAIASTDDLHHPLLIMDQKRLTLWLQAQVYSQDNVALDDDVTLFIIRPEAVQKKLFEERSELGSLKNQIVKLQQKNKEQKAAIDNLTSEVDSLEILLKAEEAKNTPLLSGLYYRGAIATPGTTNIHQKAGVVGVGSKVGRVAKWIGKGKKKGGNGKK